MNDRSSVGISNLENRALATGLASELSAELALELASELSVCVLNFDREFQQWHTRSASLMAFRT